MRVLNPTVFNPVLQFRYTVFTTHLPGALFYARSAQQPGFENNPIQADYGNGYHKVKGKTTWDDLAITCYQYEEITINDLWKYFQEHHLVRFAKDQYGSSYKHQIRLVTMNPSGLVPVGTWVLHGAFYSSVKFGEMDWGNEDVCQVNLQIAFDYAEFNPLIL